jgi:hypothetical protein
VLPVQHKALEAAVAKDLKDGAALAGSTFASLNTKLSEKFKHIEALNAKYQQVRQQHEGTQLTTTCSYCLQGFKLCSPPRLAV